MPLVSVITLNYNNPCVTEALLESIPTQNNEFQLEVIVVDNGSTDDPVPAWIKKYPSFKFIRSKVNLGFSGGNNLGIKHAQGQYFFLVNNDTIFTTDLISELLVIFSRHEHVGIASPKIYYYDEDRMIQYAGFTEMNFFTGRNRCLGQFEHDHGQFDAKTGTTGYVHGAAMIVRREVIDRVGPMPEEFFLYYEEMDWCEKIRAAGYEVWVVPKALIYHKESVSVGKNSALKEYYMNRNRILFIRRNASRFQKLVFYAYFAALVMPRNILGYLRTRRAELISVLFKAITWNLRNPTHKSDSHSFSYTNR